ncbi:hypothetical protein O3P69_003744 [Scylla paramamosain]|uniref:Uncharacterized protein n=1 Tax=Scylla paramamosain TaxID=85552 RepID=A0AAW0UEF4_SCYPA
MLINWRSSHPAFPIPPIFLGRKVLRLQPAVNSLGVEVNSNLSFTSHVKNTPKTAPRLNCVRRVAHLDAQGIANLYASQVLSVMEYAPLTWSYCFLPPTSYLGLLDKPLQHKREVAGLCATYKIHRKGAPLPATLWQPWATPHPHATKDTHTR